MANERCVKCQGFLVVESVHLSESENACKKPVVLIRCVNCGWRFDRECAINQEMHRLQLEKEKNDTKWRRSPHRKPRKNHYLSIAQFFIYACYTYL